MSRRRKWTVEDNVVKRNCMLDTLMVIPLIKHFIKFLSHSAKTNSEIM